MKDPTRPAVRDGDEALLAPSVGTWWPRRVLGSPISAGQVLGVLVRDGRRLAVTAPRPVAGVLTRDLPPGTWVAYGEPVAHWGVGGAVGEAVAPEAAAAVEGLEDATPVRAETGGTVYLSPEPGAAPFAREGEAVQAQQTLALVEVMKTFTPIRAAQGGTLVRVDVDDAGSVTEGQVLFWIGPA